MALIKKFKVLAIIPARGGSQGIPKKNLVQINGKPLIYYSIQAAKESKYVTEIVVSSDDQEILKAAKYYGAIPIKRPDNISGDKSQTEDAMLHVLESLNEQPDLIVLLQPTSPMRTGKHIDEAISQLKCPYNTVISVSDHFHFGLWDLKNHKPINFEAGKRLMRQDSPQASEDGCIYVTRTKEFLKSKNRLAFPVTFYEMNKYTTLEIDDPEDLVMIRRMMEDGTKTN